MFAGEECMLTVYSHVYLSFVVYNIEIVNCVSLSVCWLSLCYLMVLGVRPWNGVTMNDKLEEAEYKRGLEQDECEAIFDGNFADEMNENDDDYEVLVEGSWGMLWWCVCRRCYGEFRTGLWLLVFVVSALWTRTLSTWALGLRKSQQGIFDDFRTVRSESSRDDQMGSCYCVSLIFLRLGASSVRSARSSQTISERRVGVRVILLSSPWRV